MVAVLILAVGLLPAMWVFSRGSAGTMMTRDEILAHTLASSLIDFAHATGFENLAPTGPEGNVVAALTLGTRKLEVDPRFECRMIVVPVVPGEPDADWPISYKTVTAEIHWKSGEIAQTYVLSMQVFQGTEAAP